MIRTKYFFLLLSTIAYCMAGVAQAALISATAQLNYAQEVSPSNTTPSTATGNATLTVDDVTGLYDLFLEVDGIVTSELLFLPIPSGDSPIHIHDAPAGVNGPVVVNSGIQGVINSVFSGPNETGFTLTVDDGLFATDGGTTAAGNIAELLAGSLYLNVHTADYTSGEIRGQLAVAAVSEPPVSLLLAFGLLSLLAWRRNA